VPGEACPWCLATGSWHRSGCPLADPSVGPPCGRLHGPDGAVVARFDRVRPARVRLMRLDADGQPDGHSVELSVREVVTTERPAPAGCVPPAPLVHTTETVTIHFVGGRRWGRTRLAEQVAERNGAVTLVRSNELCRCDHQRWEHTGEGGSCGRVGCHCTRFTPA
jgi:hypothetical protein